MSSQIDLIDIYHAYESDDVVQGVTLSVGEGEIVCILGPSGCGKTTCLRIAAGLERPRQGEVRIGGALVAGRGVFVPPENRRVGLVLQDYALFPDKTVLNNVIFGMSGLNPRERRQRGMELLDAVGLADEARSYPHQLSGGQQQRVALIRALAPEPTVMLMDEPFSSLDVTLRGGIRDETVALLKRRGVPTLLVTHDPEEALQMADRIAIMENGKIIQCGTPDEIYTKPVNPFVMSFFGQSNRIRGKVQNGQIRTIFGVLPVNGVPDDADVDVLFRSTALRPSERAELKARVEGSRLLGPIERLELRLDGLCETVFMDCVRRGERISRDQINLIADLSEFHVFVKAFD